MQGLIKRSKSHTITLNNIIGTSEFTEQCRQDGKKRLTGEKVLRLTYTSRAAELSSSLSENNHSSFGHIPEPGMRKFRSSHYSVPSAKPNWMDKRTESKQSSNPAGCLRCEDFSHFWRNCDVDPGNVPVKQQ